MIPLHICNLFEGLKNQRKGAVLIEFAFAIPTLIIIMYFLLDVPSAYRISSKLQKISELYAAMLLNINKREQSRAVTINDLKNISKGIGLIFTGIIGSSKHPYYLSTYVTCVKGTGSNNFSKKWNVHIKNNLKDGNISSFTDEDLYSTIDNKSTNFSLSKNIKDFIIENGEIKLIIETLIWYSNINDRGFNSKFYILTIPGILKNGAKTFGDKHSIISPPEGLVSDTPPK